MPGKTPRGAIISHVAMCEPLGESPDRTLLLRHTLIKLIPINFKGEWSGGIIMHKYRTHMQNISR